MEDNFSHNCDHQKGGSHDKNFVLELTDEELKDNIAMGAFNEIDIKYTQQEDKYRIDMTLEQYEKYKENCGMFV